MPVELYVALSGFAGSARAYAQMAADARDDTGLRGAAGRLVAQAREIDALVSGAGAPSVQDPWRLTQEHVARLSNLYTLGYVARGVTRGAISQASRTAPAASVIGSGRFRWRGRVDGSDYIMLQNSQVTIRHIEYRSIRDTSYDLPVPLPQRSLQLTLTKLKGRGNVEIVRQPSAENNYTLTVLIEDTPSGDDFYEFEVVW